MSEPIWKLFVDGTDTSVTWIDHGPNHRFAIYNRGTRNPSDDLIWDKETGLIWPRNANLLGKTFDWWEANRICRSQAMANRLGWRLPTVEELSSLIDDRNSSPALPTGHPFISVFTGTGGYNGYWTSTNTEGEPGQPEAYFVVFASGVVAANYKEEPGGRRNQGYVWPVRGGRGGVNWK